MGSADKQGKLWGTAVADWAIINEPHHEPYWHAMLDDLDVGEGSVVLDAGCGAGVARNWCSNVVPSYMAWMPPRG